MAWTRRMSGNEVLESYREGQLAYPVGDDSVLGTVAQVWSRGSLRLTGGSSADPLNVDPGLLTDPLDSHRMLLVVRHLKALLSSQGAQAHPISWVDGRFIQELPEEDHQSILRWAKQAVAPASDLAAGCRIGHGGDNSSVVDYQGQVHGIDGVSVADLSIVPALVKADPWLTGMVVGRRVAEFLQPSDPATT